MQLEFMCRKIKKKIHWNSKKIDLNTYAGKHILDPKTLFCKEGYFQMSLPGFIENW